MKFALKSILWSILIVLLLLVLMFLYIQYGIKTVAPEVPESEFLHKDIVELDPYTFKLNQNWLRKNKFGLYEMYLEGNAYDRGLAYGKLAVELVRRQEDHFTEQIFRMVPSKFVQNSLKFGIKWFNRNMSENIPEEYLQEIYGVSRAASDQYEFIGDKYHRILNYHAAHDIGHAVQNLAKVGCTSFATWDEQSEDSSLILGRNFDFYVGDKFAEEKIVAFYRPDKGHKFMMITWAGFIGVVSGMNDQGLTVTINAAKSSMPGSSATPVSILAREILQYAANIEEAYIIAAQRKMFVSESFLIGSAQDGRAVIIEKTPDELAMYEPAGNKVLCTNHFQSSDLESTPLNLEQKAESASVYRYNRLNELITANEQNSVFKTVQILRDLKGLNGTDIGIGNEKAINQMIAHHSVVFQPEKLKVWVSTAPWQLGSFVAYDLNKVFAVEDILPRQEIAEIEDNIDAASILSAFEFHQYMQFRTLKNALKDGEIVDIQKLVSNNPNFYQSYVLAGDYKYQSGEFDESYRFYKEALTKEIATIEEKDYILSQMEKCREHKR